MLSDPKHDFDAQDVPAESKLRAEVRAGENGRLLLYPPGVVDKLQFLQRCTGGGSCAAACPNDSIILVSTETDLRLPFIDPARSPCYLCRPSPCVEACTEGALQKFSRETMRMGTAQLDPYRCLCFKGQECTICFDSCPLQGIAIIWDNEVQAPLISMEHCVGCGVCLFECPAPEKPISILTA